MNDRFKHLSDTGLKALFDQAVRALAVNEGDRRAAVAEINRRRQARKAPVRGPTP